MLLEMDALTPEEKHIIEEKGTEAPYTGEYTDFFQEGTYICRKCGSALYRSKDKFHSGCGWPSFDDAIPGKVRMTIDEDGLRTEITCSTCGGHLGHVFVGEQLTEKNTRHCVNSLSMKFIHDEQELMYEEAIFGGGCFWCLDAGFRMIKGVLDVHAGYEGGTEAFPTYELVCTGKSGYVEVVRVRYLPDMVTYEQLLKIFFTLHDPTQKDRQGNDVGPQYKSVIFFTNDQQRVQALKVMQDLDQEHIWEQPLVTELIPHTHFWLAESYHQNYFADHGKKPYCQLIIAPKIAKLRQTWAHLLT